MNGKPDAEHPMIASLFRRGALFALLWWILTEGHADAWGIGLIAVAAALGASLHLLPPGPRRLRLPGLLAFLGHFVWDSRRGGLQVAGLALRGPQALQPGLLDLELGLPPGPPCILLVNTIGLMPGTLGVRLRANRLRLHVLDRRLPVEAEVRALEGRIRRLFGVPT
jgi:multicomponent Na+:H+ antiporter subunit E